MRHNATSAPCTSDHQHPRKSTQSEAFALPSLSERCRAAMQMRKLLRPFLRTPLHPQWLLGRAGALGPWVAMHAHGVVLDIGCADRWIERLLPTGTRYVGVDYWETGKNLYKAQPDIYADAAMLPLATESCDCVVLLEVLEHIRNPQAALHEIARVLRPGGKLLLSIPFLYPTHDAPHDYQRLTHHGLDRDLENAGLQVISTEARLSTIETAAMLCCLALGGSALQSLQQRHPSLLLAPVLAALIPVINIMGWLLTRLLPHWPAFTSGFRALAHKPGPARTDTSGVTANSLTG